jgi:hypothetical protein
MTQVRFRPRQEHSKSGDDALPFQALLSSFLNLLSLQPHTGTKKARNPGEADQRVGIEASGGYEQPVAAELRRKDPKRPFEISGAGRPIITLSITNQRVTLLLWQPVDKPPTGCVGRVLPPCVLF